MPKALPISRLVCITLGLCIAVPASAQLVEVDLLAPGDALVTRDTQTNLDWLDLDLTFNLSYNAVIGGAGGWVADGWTHATEAQVCDLSMKLGEGLTTCPGSNSSVSENLCQMRFDLFGFGLDLGILETSSGIFGSIVDNRVQVGICQHVPPGSTVAVSAGQLGVSPDFTSGVYGHFLVRQAPVGTPASSSWSLATLGVLLAVGIARYSRRATA